MSDHQLTPSIIGKLECSARDALDSDSGLSASEPIVVPDFETVEKWSEYVEKCVREDELKKILVKKPLFLPRNIRTFRSKNKDQDRDDLIKNEEVLKHSAEAIDATECKFNVNNFKMVFVVKSESYLYRRNSINKARMSHKRVSQSLNNKFADCHDHWLSKNASKDGQAAVSEVLQI